MIDGAAFARALLEASLTEDVGRGLAGNHQNGLPVGIGVGDAGDQIGRPWPSGGDAGRDLAGDPCIAAGHKRGPLLVLGKYRLDVGVIERIVDRQNVGPGHTENVFDTQMLHIADD